MLTALIIDQCHEWLMKGLSTNGVDVSYRPEINRGELLKAIVTYDMLIVRSKTPIDKEMIDAGKQLKYIGRAGAGMDNVDVAYAESKGIECIHAGGANADAVGEHTLGMMLALSKKIIQSHRQVQNYIWDREANRGFEWKGKTLGIIGYGNTGSAVARKLRGFEMNILAYDKYKSDYKDEFVSEVSLENIYEYADAITLHVPLTSETKSMIDSAFISRFKKNVYIFNASRGEVVVTEDLVQALESGKVLGCGLDVLENEKLSQLSPRQTEIYKKLFTHPRTVLTPHVGGWSEESYLNISVTLLERILQKI